MDFVLTYDHIFEQPRLEPKKHLDCIPIKGALYQLISWVNNEQLIIGNSKPQMEILISLLNSCDIQSYRKTASFLNNPSLKSKEVQIIWLLPHTALSLIEFILREYHSEIFKNQSLDINGLLKEYKDFSDQNVYDLIRAYFSIERKRGKNVHPIEGLTFDEIIIRNFTDRIGTYELERGDDSLIYFAEFIKSIDFFSFIEEEYPNELMSFMSIREISSWELYVLHVMGFFEKFIYQKENYLHKIRVLSKASIFYFDLFQNHEAYKAESPNFRKLKNFPLLKYNGNGYLMIYRTFLFEKMYKALFFDFQSIADKDIKSNIGKKFFEEILTNKYVTKIFNKANIVNIPGNSKKFKNINGEPDHYVRNWNHVFVFESKDTLISDNMKTSLNTQIVVDEIENKLVIKGVSQLVKFIETFEEKFDKFDSKVQLTKITFHPILIVQDRVLSTMGINHILNGYFQKKLTKETSSKLRIKPLIVMNIDCLILYSGIFAGQPKIFQACLDDYIMFFNKSIRVKSDLFSFDIWMRRRYLPNDNNNKMKLVYKYLNEFRELKIKQFNSGDLEGFRC